MTGDNNETWQEIKKLFRECMSLDETNRVRRLEEIRQQDDSLYKEVCGLLEQAHQTSDEMQAAVDGLAGEINSQKDSEGKHIGQYKILRQIGEGGMGSVYLCKRDDEQFEKTVAVKILNLSRPSKHLVQRFRAERQILANLQHPYIAQLLDGGETDDGLPFIVMEYVDGTPIVQYCDENQLTIKSRLKLFAKVCEAIQHAHQNFVIHRDIKSNNILINQDGDPKLVDFGIAKLLETEGLNFTVAETMADARLLTPANASPEQVLGKKITTATDVYALGLLLYELLTGQAAYDLDEVSSKALERAICESQPTAPSKKLLHSSHDTFQYRSTTKDKLERTLSGDIDTIVLKALAKEPERRYSTALELVDDVHRYLSHQPVMAQPDSFGYRAGKFIQRNRAGLLTTGGVLALVIALVGFYTTRLTQERDRADMRATESEKTADFLISILNGANKIQHTEKMTVEQLLGFAAERIAPELQGQPEVQSRLHFVIGDAYGSLDEYDKALSHMEESVDYLRQADPSHENQVQLARVAILLSIYYRNDGEYQKSEDLSHEVLALHEKLFEPDDFRISYGLNKHGQILNAKGEYSEAKEYLERAVQVGLNGVGENNEFTADAMNNLAIVYRNLGDIEGSERYYRRALAANRLLLDDRHPNLANSVSNLGGTLNNRSKFQEARVLNEEALRMRRNIYEDRPHGQVALSAEGLGVSLGGLGEFDGATKLLEEAYDITRTALGPEHPMMARRLRQLGHLHIALANYEKALMHYQESLRLLQSRLGDTHRNVYYAKRNTGDALLQLNRLDEAHPLLQEAYDGMASERTDLNIDMEPVQTPLGWYHYKVGNHEQAKEYFDKSVTNCQNTYGEEDVCVTRGLMGLAAVAGAQGDTAAERELLERAVAIRRALLPPDNWMTAESELALCEALSKTGSVEEVQRICATTLRVLQDTFGEDDVRVKRARSVGI